MPIAELIVSGHIPGANTAPAHPEGQTTPMPDDEKPVPALALATEADGDTVTAIIQHMLAAAQVFRSPQTARQHLESARALLYADDRRLPVNLFRMLNGPFNHLHGALLLLEGRYGAASSQLTAARNDYTLALAEFATPNAQAYLQLHSGLAAVLEARTSNNQVREQYLYGEGGEFFELAAPILTLPYEQGVARALAAEAWYLAGEHSQARQAGRDAVTLLAPVGNLRHLRHLLHFCTSYLPQALALREHHNVDAPPYLPLAHPDRVWDFSQFYVEQPATN